MPKPKKRSNRKKLRLLDGFKDVLPQEQILWEYVLDSAAQISRAYGYNRIDLPVLEDDFLYEKTIGATADIVSSQLFRFDAPDGEPVALRPEFTPGMARAYVEHGMVNNPQPAKMWTNGPVFRYEEVKAGQYRQFNQVGWDIIGSDHAAIDAELIATAYRLLTDMGLEVMVKVNTVGVAEDQKEYVAALKDYLKPHRKNIDEISQDRFIKDPLHILSSKDETTREILAEAPQLVDFLSDDSREHFMKVLEFLDEGDIVYHLDPFLVREQAYSSHTVFEIVLASQAEEKMPQALVAGGRYHSLVHTLGGPEGISGAGMAMGMERVVLAMKEAQIEAQRMIEPEVFLAQIGETARKNSLKLFEQMRKSGIAVLSNVSKNGLADQLAVANKSKVKITLILGQKEMIDKTIIMRDMENGSQESIMQSKLIDTIKKQLTK